MILSQKNIRSLSNMVFDSPSEKKYIDTIQTTALIYQGVKLTKEDISRCLERTKHPEFSLEKTLEIVYSFYSQFPLPKFVHTSDEDIYSRAVEIIEGLHELGHTVSLLDMWNVYKRLLLSPTVGASGDIIKTYESLQKPTNMIELQILRAELYIEYGENLKNEGRLVDQLAKGRKPLFDRQEFIKQVDQPLKNILGKTRNPYVEKVLGIPIASNYSHFGRDIFLPITGRHTSSTLFSLIAVDDLMKGYERIPNIFVEKDVYELNMLVLSRLEHLSGPYVTEYKKRLPKFINSALRSENYWKAIKLGEIGKHRKKEILKIFDKENEWSKKKVDTFIENCIRERLEPATTRTSFFWGIELHGNFATDAKQSDSPIPGTLIGLVGIHTLENDPDEYFYLTTYINNDFQKLVAYKSVAIQDALFEFWNLLPQVLVQADVKKDNIDDQKILEDIGFTRSGTKEGYVTFSAHQELIYDFPYRKLVMPSPKEMLHNLERTKFRVKNIRDQKVITRMYPNDYLSSDGISNHYTEHVRIHCRVAGKKTLAETKHELREDLKRVESPYTARELIYSHPKSGECNTFNEAFGLFIIRNTVGERKRILDPSAGWGDRLISAIAARASQYQGYDPNDFLQPGYEEIIEDLVPKDRRGYFRVYEEPFEDAILVRNNLYYDLVLTSPPYYSYEDYGEAEGQSIIRYPRYEDWLERMYLPYLTKAYQALRYEGYMVLYIEDVSIGGRRYSIREDTKSIMSQLGARPDKSFGLIIESESERRPKIRWALVWRKPRKIRPRGDRGGVDPSLTDTTRLYYKYP